MQVLLKDFGAWATCVLPKVNTPALATLRHWDPDTACLWAYKLGGAGGRRLQRAGGYTETAFPSKPERGAGWEILDSPSPFLDAHRSQLVS